MRVSARSASACAQRASAVVGISRRAPAGSGKSCHRLTDTWPVSLLRRIGHPMRPGARRGFDSAAVRACVRRGAPDAPHDDPAHTHGARSSTAAASPRRRYSRAHACGREAADEDHCFRDIGALLKPWLTICKRGKSQPELVVSDGCASARRKKPQQLTAEHSGCSAAQHGPPRHKDTGRPLAGATAEDPSPNTLCGISSRQLLLYFPAVLAGQLFEFLLCGAIGIRTQTSCMPCGER